MVDAKPTKRISDKDVARLNIYARNMAGGGSRILGKIFAVPKGVSADKVPRGWRSSSMNRMSLRWICLRLRQ
ncbi:hypothetical protein E2P71_09810 [Candidatus Bathyarchaeota archaeon]|nr:hypothetical protein E2P71_09810 [Candidatus Bathyarchaeota archaeon]